MISSSLSLLKGGDVLKAKRVHKIINLNVRIGVYIWKCYFCYIKTENPPKQVSAGGFISLLVAEQLTHQVFFQEPPWDTFLALFVLLALCVQLREVLQPVLHTSLLLQ